MYFLLGILSMLGYAIQGTFLVRHSRSIESFSLAVYRNLSLGLSMLPVFLFVEKGDLTALAATWKLLLSSCLFGAGSLGFLFRAQRSLPIGIVGAFTGIRVLFLLFWAFLFLRETLSGAAIALIFVILSGIAFLSLQKNHFPHLDGKTFRGFFFLLLSSVFGSVAFFQISLISRMMNPLLAGYLWEIGIGGGALCIVLIRGFLTGRKLEKISARTFWKITAISSWTLLGTGAFTLAVNYGPLGIVNALGSAGIIVSTLLSHFLYEEKLTFRQWIGIFIVTLGIAGLKFAGF